MIKAGKPPKCRFKQLDEENQDEDHHKDLCFVIIESIG